MNNRTPFNAAAMLARPADHLARLAHSRHPVLLTGERGAGKTTTALRLHQLSPRRAGPWVDLNCATLTENLLEAELFGYEKGAFTGAGQAKKGLLETAHGGTLFLDEVGELPGPLQAKLLKAVEEGVIRRVGACHSRPVDVRLLTATAQDLPALVQAGRFRADLYDRLAVLCHHTPPLRARPDEIPGLAQARLALESAHYGGSFSITTDALAFLQMLPWPGNIRALHNFLARLTAHLGTPQSITLAAVQDELAASPDLGAALPQTTASPATAVPVLSPAWQVESLPPGETLDGFLGRLERDLIAGALAQTGGNFARAAQRLGVRRSTLQYRWGHLNPAPPQQLRATV